jgi:hypothetical protein
MAHAAVDDARFMTGRAGWLVRFGRLAGFPVGPLGFKLNWQTEKKGAKCQRIRLERMW